MEHSEEEDVVRRVRDERDSVEYSDLKVTRCGGTAHNDAPNKEHQNDAEKKINGARKKTAERLSDIWCGVGHRYAV